MWWAVACTLCRRSWAIIFLRRFSCLCVRLCGPGGGTNTQQQQSPTSLSVSTNTEEHAPPRQLPNEVTGSVSTADQPMSGRRPQQPSQDGRRSKGDTRTRQQPGPSHGNTVTTSNRYTPLQLLPSESAGTTMGTPEEKWRPPPRTASAKAPKLPATAPQINTISRGYYLPGKLAAQSVRFL